MILAADHRARGIITIESYSVYVHALRAAIPHCDAVMASAKPLSDLKGHADAHGLRTYLSLNRTGLAGSAFELDDRPVASPERAAGDGHSGVKLMTRIDLGRPESAAGLELLGKVLEASYQLGLDALIEPLSWSHGRVDRTTDGILTAAVIAHDMGAPLLKVPVPLAAPGSERSEAVARITASVGVPILFLGGPRPGSRKELLEELADAMAGGAAGMAVGRAVYQDPDPAEMAGLVADLVHGRRSAGEVLAQAG